MFDSYQIKYGDSFESIANKYNTSKEYLMSINNIYFEDNLRQGMDIIVPKSKEKYFIVYKIKKGDSLYKISKDYNINPELLANMNGININDYIYPDQELIVPKSGYSYYITAEGDTLDIVSSKFKKPINYLLQENETIYLSPNQLIVSKTKER